MEWAANSLIGIATINAAMALVNIDFDSEIPDLIERLGVPLGGLICVTYLLVYCYRNGVKDRESHRQERKDWKVSIEKMQDKTDMTLNVLRESNERMENRNIKALEELTKAINKRNI